MEIEYYMKNIAYYIIDKCGQMSTFRLHKLLYVCQAWYMAWNNGCPLFYEDFEAWINGPVIRELFETHKGLYEIDKHLIKGNIIPIDEKITKQIDKVLFYYNYLNNLDFIVYFHNESVWKITRDKFSETFEFGIIKKYEIYNYYKNRHIETELNNYMY